MKILHKQNLLNMLDTLYEAHKEFSITERKATLELLCLCQESAIAIGNSIEKSEKMDIITIKYLEDYCELLYQISIDDNLEHTWDNHIQKINQQLCYIKESIQNDISCELYEVLFMPYNASMWDSMDSVYKEAIKDDRCNVVVMPIPYFNIDKDGEVVNERYEGDRFPDYIKVTDYAKYNIHEKSPDMIFIHNPYDQYNRVTRIPEKYYSSNLCKYTNHLVYLPYYISDSKTDEMNCIMPGVKNAWRVFVQSETVRQQFIKWNSPEKIISMGSPKIDMVINLERNKPSIPLEWSAALSGKKVFLYNSHLSNIMNVASDFMNKLKCIFGYFKNCNEIAILWRPHPLSVETARSMHPQVLDEYMHIIEEFKQMDNGVYDDTSDNQRAIALSDAYIGDRSSMLTLYKVTGKPIYIMNDSNNELMNKYITCLDANIEDEILWMFSKEINALFKMNLLTKKVEFMDSITCESKFGKALYKEIIPYKNKLFLIPSSADNIVEYDLEKQNQKYYKSDRKRTPHGVKNANVIVENNYVYMYPKFYGDNIEVLDMDTGEINIIKIEYESLDNVIENRNATIWGSGVKLHDVHWIPMTQSNHIVSIDKTNIKIYDVESKNKGFISGTFDGKNIWMAPNIGSKVVKWNPKNKISVEYETLLSGCIIRASVPFSNIVYFNQSIWLIPSNSNMLVKINIHTGEMCGQDIGDDRYISYKIYKDSIYLFPYQGNHIIKISTLEDKVEYIDMEYPSKYNNKDFLEYYAHNVEDINCENHIYTSDFCGLDKFIHMVIQYKGMYSNESKKNLGVNIDNIDGTSGMKIWNYIWDNLETI